MTTRQVPQDAGLAIQNILSKFETGDASIFSHFADDIDFCIEHYRDDTDVAWQVAKNVQQLGALMGRLGSEVFPQGTKVLGRDTTELGDGWYMTRFEQRFFYAVRQNMVESRTYIISHEIDGKLDYFRETVTTVTDI